MNKIKNIAFSALLSLGAFGAVTYTACTKDECKDVVCQNGGTCAGGSCNCTTGYEGATCQTESRAKYAGDYKGTGTDNGGNTYTNWTMSFSAPSGSAVTGMTLTLKNAAGATILTFPITLVYNSSASTFTITSTTVGSFTYTGSGTISTTSASATINQAGTPALVIQFNNFTRQ